MRRLRLPSTFASNGFALRGILWSALLTAGLMATGCDNPACVFGPNGCQQVGAGGGVGIGTLPASIPANGDQILDGAPFITGFTPRDNRGTPDSVVTLTMSESMSADSLLDGFELVDVVSGTPIPILQPTLLTGGGRVVVMVPANPFSVGQSVRVQATDDSTVSDLTGQALSLGNTNIVAEFTVTTAPTSPSVATVFPGDDSTNQSEFSEIVVVFDREMDAMTFSDASFDVSVNQSPAAVDPSPRSLSIPGATTIPVTQVWAWRGLGADGFPVSVGQVADVDLVLSPNGSELQDLEGEELPTTTFQFRTSAVGAPTSVVKAATSLPLDAIGMPNLVGVGPVLEVALATTGQPGDQLGVFLIGRTATRVSALLRRVAIADGAMTVTVSGPDLNLLTDGGAGLFLSGDLQVAVRHERGTQRSPLRLLDTEPDTVGIQPLVFDVTPPVLEGFGPNGSSSFEMRSDMRGLVVVGRADDQVREVEVITSTLGDTGVRLDVVASSPDGTFIARPVSNPVALDIIDPVDLPQAFNIRLFDRAMNASAMISGSYVQTGVVGGGAALPGGRVLVDVYNANTLAPIANAFVMTQQDNGGVVTDRSIVAVDAGGYAEPLSAAVGETILIVDAPGYDLFTFHGVPTQRIQVPLTRTVLPTSLTRGQVVGEPGANFSSDTNGIADSRRAPIFDGVFPTQACSGSLASGFTCAFLNSPIRPQRLGAQAFFAVNSTLNVVSFNPFAFLRAYALRFPAPWTPTGQADVATLAVPALLNDLSAEEQPIAFDTRTLSIAAAGNLGVLDGAPRVSVLGVAPGLPGGVPVGSGLALDDGGGGFDVVGAYVGIADGIESPPGLDLPGALVASGSIEADLIVEVEVVDMSANRVGRRRRISAGAGVMSVPDVPSLLTPAPGGNAGGVSYDLAVRNVILDGSGQGGLYEVVLSDQQGRDWHLWRIDRPDASGDIEIHVSDLSGFGRSGLANGPIVAQVSAHAWSGFNGNSFLWTDIERIQDQFAHTDETNFSQP